MKVRQATLVEPFASKFVKSIFPTQHPTKFSWNAKPVPSARELKLAALHPAPINGSKIRTLADWKFPFRSGYSAAGRIVAIGSGIVGGRWRTHQFNPGNHAG